MYERCECKVGDIPHYGEAVHKRPMSRCTRAVTHTVRKAGGIWHLYCEQCAMAIRAYQGSNVEVHALRRCD